MVSSAFKRAVELITEHKQKVVALAEKLIEVTACCCGDSISIDATTKVYCAG